MLTATTFWSMMSATGMLSLSTYSISHPIEGETAMNKMRVRKLHKVFHFAGPLMRWMGAGPIIPAVLSGIALLFLAGFTSGSAGDDHQDERDKGASKAAIERFWSVYHGNQYSAIPRVQAQLQSALQHDPDNSTLYALLGATYFWHY